MAATTITALSVTDDDGTGTTGTIWNAALQASFESNINGLFSSTSGITQNQAAGTGSILTFESSDVAHGITSILPTAAFGRVVRAVAATGGLTLTGATEDLVGLNLQAIATNGDTNKTTSAVAVAQIRSSAKSGTTTGAVGANANLLVVANDTTTRFIMDADGDSHQDVGTAWTNFDSMDDVAVLHALSAAVSREDDPLKAQFARYLESHRPSLEAGRFVTFNEDGHHFINWSRTHMLVIGAVRQLGMRLDAIESRLALPGGPSVAALKG